MTETEERTRNIRGMTDQEREAEHQHALAHHLFWIPCPLCARPFGGHEWPPAHGSIGVPGQSASAGQGVCPDCAGAPETLAHEEAQRQWFAQVVARHEGADRG